MEGRALSGGAGEGGKVSTSGFNYQPIGIIHSPHFDPPKTPVQPVYAEGIEGRVEVYAEYEEGLMDLEGFSHIYLIYAFHRSDVPKLMVRPFLGDREHGVFATRAPNRPNPLGISLVRLVSRRGRILQVEDIDVLDGTPLLDIKPYVSRFDSRQGTRHGWQDDIDEETARLRGRRDYDGGEPGDPHHQT